MFCVTHQGLVGTLENVAHILTGTRLRMVPTDESKMVGLLDTLRQSQDKRGTGINHSEGRQNFWIFVFSQLRTATRRRNGS